MSSEGKEPEDSSNLCSVNGCGKKSVMVCPTCKQLDLPQCYFCSQECFKSSWKTHKKVHKVPARASAAFNGYSFTGPLRPGYVSPMRTVPDSIAKPDYAVTSIPLGEQESRKQGRPSIVPKTPEEYERLRAACVVGREVIDVASSMIKVGVTTDKIDQAVHAACIERNAYPSPLNYMRFPKSLCTSVNEIICHGIPDNRPLEDGDILNLDITVYIHGMHADLNETFLVGNVAPESVDLVRVAYESLRAAVAAGEG